MSTISSTYTRLYPIVIHYGISFLVRMIFFDEGYPQLVQLLTETSTAQLHPYVTNSRMPLQVGMDFLSYYLQFAHTKSRNISVLILPRSRSQRNPSLKATARRFSHSVQPFTPSLLSLVYPTVLLFLQAHCFQRPIKHSPCLPFSQTHFLRECSPRKQYNHSNYSSPSHVFSSSVTRILTFFLFTLAFVLFSQFIN